jgi:hypothetical protein
MEDINKTYLFITERRELFVILTLVMVFVYILQFGKDENNFLSAIYMSGVIISFFALMLSISSSDKNKNGTEEKPVDSNILFNSYSGGASFEAVNPQLESEKPSEEFADYEGAVNSNDEIRKSKKIYPNDPKMMSYMMNAFVGSELDYNENVAWWSDAADMSNLGM